MRTLFIAVFVSALFSGPVLARSLKDTLESTGLSGGLVVVVSDERLESFDEVDLGERFIVQFLHRDVEQAEASRGVIHTQGIGARISASSFDGTDLPYVDNLVNLLIINDDSTGIPRDEILRVLAPSGTVVSCDETIVKPWPDDMDSWPHWLHGPDNNAVSQDQQIGVSRNLQWVMPPRWGRHHNLLYSVNALVSEAGRLYYIMDEAPVGIRSTEDQWMLGCRDAFNGIELWKRPITNWGWSKWSDVETGGTMRFRGPDQLFRRLVAHGDLVYVTLGFNEPVVALDGRTGHVLQTYAGTEETATIQIDNGVLYLTRNVLGERPGKTVMAVDASSGAVMWEQTGIQGISPHGTELARFSDAHLTVGLNNLFLVDDESIAALNRTSGEEVWRVARPAGEDTEGHYLFNFRDYCTLVYVDGRLLLGQIYPDSRNLNAWQEKDMHILAFDAATGELEWEHIGMSLAHFTPPDLFVNKGRVWTMRKGDVALIGLNLATGCVEREYPVKDMLVGHHHRCYRNKATSSFYLAGEEGIEYIDFETGELEVHHWLRGACSYGIMPANGMIYLPSHACGCHGNAKLNGFIAMTDRSHAEVNVFDADAVINEDTGSKWPHNLEGPHRRQNIDADAAINEDAGANWPVDRVGINTPQPEPRLETGPAFSRVSELNSPASSNDWPTYKHDNGRSNATDTPAPTELSQRWDAILGGELTAPIIVGGRVFVASGENRAVYCLDAETGERLWTFLTDGRIDSPPTYFNGRLLFGTRAGSVYAVTAAQGELIWRFQAAPSPQCVMAYGQLESIWPVHGTILVHGDAIFCTAGRSMNLDGGLLAYSLDPDTGGILQKARYKADGEVKGEVKGSVVSGILVTDDETISMRGLQIDPVDITQRTSEAANTVLTPAAGGLLDSSWYNSAYWKYKKANAQMLVFDDEVIIGLAAYQKQQLKSYSHDVATVGEGYSMFAMKPERDTNAPQQAWRVLLPVRAEAIILTSNAVCAAGAPDRLDPDDPWGAFENRQGGVLMLISREDGMTLREVKLNSAPVYDGMAAAEGRLFLSLKDGRLVCF
jgi:outer membrane protein assembly factor BamB